ncbi:MAG: MurR/RpiR family transcriptional regulator [Proteobacteria bacterium]|nr:MurR/RpiR family transcriptional regulator [Pseudomonadota bacterium]MBI3497611.1 MurR/RpiR family transcriptional regulator [Pseudomonadota bacterium]
MLLKANKFAYRNRELEHSNGNAEPRITSTKLEALLQDRRLTPGQRRIAQCLIENSEVIGFLSSGELAQRANVSQPSVTRFALALGFEGYLDMRRQLRSGKSPRSPDAKSKANRYQAAALAESANVADLATSLPDLQTIRAVGTALAQSKPLVVLGLRASSGLATQFCYYAAKIHPDVRLISTGGSLVEDTLEQAQAAGGKFVLTFMMPLYPRETITALRFAKQIGLKVALVSDSTFSDQDKIADLLLRGRINSSLVFDSYAAMSVLIAVLLDAMCDAMAGRAQVRLDAVDLSSKRRKVFV